MAEDRRRELQLVLEGYFGLDTRVADASLHVSYQPDEKSQIKYPHIVYSRDPAYKVRADNIAYRRVDKYVVIYIDRDADSPIVDELDKRPYTSHKASFVEDGLNHYVFDLYY
jgi:hypothetical protein